MLKTEEFDQHLKNILNGREEKKCSTRSKRHFNDY